MGIKLGDLKKKENILQRVEFQEDNLHNIYPNVCTEKGKTVKLIAGLDLGGSQSRILFLSKEQTDIELQYAIPSRSYSPAIDLALATLNELLYDNMDTTVQDLGARSGFVGKTRLVRATKSKRVSTLKENELTSSVDKVKSPTLYLNILDSIGYAMLQFYKNLPETVVAKVGLALPPKELMSPKQVTWFKNQINGRYLWTYNKTGASTTIDLECEIIKTEPEAFAQCQFLLAGLDFPELNMHLSGGSRSIGVEILRFGESIFNQTFDYGGTQLIASVADALVMGAKGVEPVITWRPDLEDVRIAIETGYLKDGSSTINIVDTIKAVKLDYAEKIFQQVTKQVLDLAGYKYRQIECVTYDGKLFWSGDYDCSISDIISRFIKQESPQTTCVDISPENKIPLGCLCGTLFEKYASVFGIEDDSDGEFEDEDIEDEAIEEVASSEV